MKNSVLALVAFILIALHSSAQTTNAPSFTTNPNSLTTCEFNSATFDVIALDYDSLRWQIFSNSTWNDLADTGAVSGSGTSSW